MATGAIVRVDFLARCKRGRILLVDGVAELVRSLLERSIERLHSERGFPSRRLGRGIAGEPAENARQCEQGRQREQSEDEGDEGFHGDLRYARFRARMKHRQERAIKLFVSDLLALSGANLSSDTCRMSR